MSPEQFELWVKSVLDKLGDHISGYRSGHRQILQGTDGDYEIDVVVKFTAFGGVDYLTCVECKYCKRPIEREKVQALFTKMQAVGAQKAILFSVSGFQSGATDFAETHGIALIEVIDGRCVYNTRSIDDGPKDWSQIPPGVPKVVGLRHQGNRRTTLSPEHPEYLLEYFHEPV